MPDCLSGWVMIAGVVCNPDQRDEPAGRLPRIRVRGDLQLVVQRDDHRQVRRRQAPVSGGRHAGQPVAVVAGDERPQRGRGHAVRALPHRAGIAAAHQLIITRERGPGLSAGLRGRRGEIWFSERAQPGVTGRAPARQHGSVHSLWTGYERETHLSTTDEFRAAA